MFSEIFSSYKQYELKISENTEIEYGFQCKALFHLSSNLHTSFLSAFKKQETTYKAESQTSSNYIISSQSYHQKTT